MGMIRYDLVNRRLSAIQNAIFIDKLEGLIQQGIN